MPRNRPSSLSPSLYLAAPSQAARFNCAFINATLIYGYRVAKGFFFFSDFFCKYLNIFSLSFAPSSTSTSFFFCFSCSYSNCCLARCLYCFSTQFVGRTPRAFCLILFGSQLPQQQTQQQQQHATDQMRLQNCSLLLLLLVLVLWLPKLLTLQRSQIADL